MLILRSFLNSIAAIGFVTFSDLVLVDCFASFVWRYNSPVSSHSRLHLHNDDDIDLNVEDNPTIDPNRYSLSHVRYGDVVDALEPIYPKEDLSKRNAMSRKDGYWQFIESGEDPPKYLTYGEFDMLFFAELLDRAHFHFYESSTVEDGKENPLD